MVEMKRRGRTTFDATSLITLPNLQLHPAWDQPIIFYLRRSNRQPASLVMAGKLKLELKNVAASGLFGPAVN